MKTAGGSVRVGSDIEVAPYQRKLGRENEEKQLAELAAKGMTVTKDINKGVWYKIMEGTMGEFIQC